MSTSSGTVAVASAWAAGGQSAERAVETAVAGLGGSAPALVLVFPDVDCGPDEVLAQARAAAPVSPLAGLSSDGLLTAGGVRNGGVAALAFGPDVRVGIGVAREASADQWAAGRHAAATATAGLDLVAGHSVLLLFMNPGAGDEAEVIDGAYDAVGARVPLAGGGANGRAPVLYAGDEALTDGVVAVALVTPEPLGVGVAHGCTPMGMPAIVTGTKGRAVTELDGRDAVTVYLEQLGVAGQELDPGELERLAVLHPLGQPELRGQLRLRHVRGPAPGGGLAVASHLPLNAVVWPTEQSHQSIVESARAAARSACGPMPDGRPGAALVFDCAARKRALGPRLASEADALLTALGDPPAVAGLYTRGEAGRVRGAKGDLNHAVVVVTFA